MIELLTTSEMAEADRLTIARETPGITLMENAGRAVADRVCSVLQGRRVIVVAGTGNNGGDGFVAARIVAERGHDVRVLLVGDRARLKGDAALAAGYWKGRTDVATPEALGARDCVVVDALFGAGLDRPVEGLPGAIINAMNAGGDTIVAVDLPSGINGTTGQVMGAAVRATHTVTFFRRKPGHVLLPGRLHCGAISVADIGIADSVLADIKPAAFLNRPALWAGALPVPQPDGHKYSRGHAVIVSGEGSKAGAARLAARGALRAGAGLVTLAGPPDAVAINATASLAVMVREVEGAAGLADFLTDKRLNAVVLGPGAGVGRALQEQVLAALASEAAIVLDADALTSFAETPDVLFGALQRRAEKATILTPHTGEYSRLFSAIDKDMKVIAKLEKARAAARLSGAVVLLKGADTVVAAADGRAAVADNAPPYLATAGAGDVLSGMIAGLLAQGMPAFEAASAAVWLHGEAASAFGPGLIAEDLPDMVPHALRRLLAGLAAPG